MINKTRAKVIKTLYTLKENIKSRDMKVVSQNIPVDILDLMEMGFGKLEYFHTIETKYSISSFLEDRQDENDLNGKRAVAEVALYVTLIGYLDRVIGIGKHFLENQCRAAYFDSSMIVYIGSNLRARIIEDYLDDTSEKVEEYIKIIMSEDPYDKKVEKLLSLIKFTQIDKQPIIFEAIQAYLEGVKLVKKASIRNLEDIKSLYENRQSAYIKYKTRCDADVEQVKNVLQNNAKLQKSVDLPQSS